MAALRFEQRQICSKAHILSIAIKCDHSNVGRPQIMICYVFNMITVIQMHSQDIHWSNLQYLETDCAPSHGMDIVIFLKLRKLNDLQSIYDCKGKMTSPVTNFFIWKYFLCFYLHKYFKSSKKSWRGNCCLLKMNLFKFWNGGETLSSFLFQNFFQIDQNLKLYNYFLQWLLTSANIIWNFAC